MNKQFAVAQSHAGGEVESRELKRQRGEQDKIERCLYIKIS